MISMCRRMNGAVQSLPTLVLCEDRVVQLVKRSELFLVDEIELLEISSSRF